MSAPDAHADAEVETLAHLMARIEERDAAYELIAELASNDLALAQEARTKVRSDGVTAAVFARVEERRRR